MVDPEATLAIYLHLAQASLRRRRPQVRARVLLLAAVEAAGQQLTGISRYCRNEILVHNPAHLIGKWETVEQALLDDDFLGLLRQLRRRYPLEKAEQLLRSLGIAYENEGAAYFDVVEYAAALLGVSRDSLL